MKRKILQNLIQREKADNNNTYNFQMPPQFHPHPRKKTEKRIWALFLDYLHNTLWWVDTHLNPWLFCICRLQKACFQRRAGYQEETIKGKEWAFKLGPFDCVTDWFQVRQLWEVQPEENCPSVHCLWEAGRLHGWHGAPEFQNYSRLVGFLRDERWASKILLWLIAATLKAKPRQKRGIQSVWLFQKKKSMLNSWIAPQSADNNCQHNVQNMPLIHS